MDKNKERFVKYAQKNNIAESEETLTKRLAVIPAVSRNVIETRWGLNGEKYCNSFDTLDKKLGLKGSRELYYQSMRDLENAAFVATVADRNKIGNWNVIVALGRVAVAVLNSKEEDIVYGEKVFEALDSLTHREKNVLILRFGLDGNGAKTLQEVGDLLELPREAIRRIENKSIRKLRMPARLKIFYIPQNKVGKEENGVKGYLIEEADFAVRTHNALILAGFKTIEEIMNNPHGVVSARYFSKSCARDILNFFEKNEVADTKCQEAKRVLNEFIQQREELHTPHN